MVSTGGVAVSLIGLAVVEFDRFSGSGFNRGSGCEFDRFRSSSGFNRGSGGEFDRFSSSSGFNRTSGGQFDRFIRGLDISI